MEHSPPASEASARQSSASQPPVPLSLTLQPFKNDRFCKICNERLCEGQDCMIISECNHVFHSRCIEQYLSHSSECPTCKRVCSLSELRKVNVKYQSLDKPKALRGKTRGITASQYNTRSSARNLFTDANRNTLVDVGIPTENELDNLLTPNRTQYTDNLNQNIQHNSPVRNFSNNIQPTIDYSQINFMIENTVSRLLSNLHLLPATTENFSTQNHPPTQLPPPIRNSQQYVSPQINPPIQVTMPSSQVANNLHHIPNVQGLNNSSFNEHFTIKSDKITNIIQNWHIRFDGSTQGISVDEFLYRVKVLTGEHFNNDFSVICKNLHILLSGRAREWYWRYHKQAKAIRWNDFCEALKYQYKDFKSSFDIHEELRNRKMRTNETFEAFYESVSSILDRLDKPLPETELVEILTRNLRPEIRHELLFVPIYSLAHLRKLVQMRENLLSDDYYRRNLTAKTVPNTGMRRQMAGVAYSEEHEVPESDKELGISIDAIHIPPKCWNCDQLGHFWEDCLENRNVFCYGCGEKNTYKPQCPKCSSKKISSKNFQAQNLTRNRP